MLDVAVFSKSFQINVVSNRWQTTLTVTV